MDEILISEYMLNEEERKIRKDILNVLSNSYVAVFETSQGGRPVVQVKANEKEIEKVYSAVKNVIKGMDWHHDKIVLTTQEPLYRGEICCENERRAKFFSKIYSMFLAEKKGGKSSSFGKYVRELMEEYESESKKK